MKKFIGLFFTLLLCELSFAQQNSRAHFISDSLDNYIKTSMSDWQIPGMSVAIVKDGKIIFIKGYGVKESEKNEAVDENTLFMIGSNTKAFTATTLCMLEQEKKLSLNDKVTKYLPEYKLKNPLATQEVTITDLLCHRIGFETFQGDFTYWTSKLSRTEVIKKMSSVNPLYSFRTQWGYCNAAFLTAGEIIPKITGKTWEETVSEKIIKPLKMERTLMLSKDIVNATNVASPHTLNKGNLVKIPYPLIDNLAPAGSISSSVKDMCNWLIAQLDSGKFEGKKVIPFEAIYETRKPQSIIATDQREKVHTHFYLYGLGFVIDDRHGKIVVSHTGGVNGFVSSVVLVPEEKLGIVVLTNTDQNSFFQNLTDEIRDAFLDLPFKNYSKSSLVKFKTEEEETAKWLDSLNIIIAKKNKTPTDLKNYTGIFTHELYGEIEVKLENGNLNIHFLNHPDLIGKLEYIQNNNFLCTYSDVTMGIKEIAFKTENGKITALTLRVADFVEFTPYEFVKKN